MGMMTSDNQINSEIDSLDLNNLRVQLQSYGAWPEAGDIYLSLMATSLWDRISIRPKDFEWIPQVVEDVKKGVDIGLIYPSFFQKLLANSELRSKFIQTLQ